MPFVGPTPLGDISFFRQVCPCWEEICKMHIFQLDMRLCSVVCCRRISWATSATRTAATSLTRSTSGRATPTPPSARSSGRRSSAPWTCTMSGGWGSPWPWSSRIKIKITETTSVPVHWCFCPFLFYNLLIIHFSPFYFCLKISANFIETYYLLFSCISCFCNHIDHLATWVWAATLQLPSILHKVLPFFR